MESTKNDAYNEVLEVLKYISKDEYEKIPKEKINYYKQNKNETYNYRFDSENNKISRKACVLLVKLYITYIASDEEKNDIYKQLQINSDKIENEKRQLYNPDNLFKNNKTEDKKESSLVEVKAEKWYKKIFLFLKKFLKR